MTGMTLTMRDLVTNTEQAVQHASDVIRWLEQNGEDPELRAHLERFVARPDLHLAQSLIPAVEALDARLRHHAQSPPASHRLIGRLGAIKRLALDLQHLAADGAVLDGSLGLLEIPVTQIKESPAEPVGGLATPPRAPVATVLVVEDDPWWRSKLASKAQAAFPKARCETFSTYRKARDRFEELARQKGVLVILDLGLPEIREDEPADDTTRGMELLRIARSYENNWRVVVVTRPRNYLEDQVAATRSGVQPEDYIFKVDDGWEAEVEDSLRRLSAPGISRLELVHDDGLRRGIIRAGDVEFTLDGRPFFILKSLAEMRGQTATEQQILDALEAQGDGQPAGFSDSLIKIRQAFVEAWAEVGRHLSPGDVLRTEETVPGGKPLYRLVPEARVVASSEATPSPVVASRALVVDDEPVAADEEARWLRRLGLEVRTASCGEEATAVAAEFRPHIICLDLALPWKAGGAVDPQGGLQALDAMRAQVGMSEARAVVVSAVARDDRIRRAGLLRGIRVDDWLYKGDVQLESWVVRSCSRLVAEIERGVVLSARARSPWVIEISRTRPRAALDGRPLWKGPSKALWQFLKVLAERPWLPVSVVDVEEALGAEDDDVALRGRAKRLRRAAGEEAHDDDSFIKGIVGGYVLRATVIWVD